MHPLAPIMKFEWRNNKFYILQGSVAMLLHFKCDHALDHLFHTNIIAYCQQNRYARRAIYTDLFTLRQMVKNYFFEWTFLKTNCRFFMCSPHFLKKWCHFIICNVRLVLFSSASMNISLLGFVWWSIYKEMRQISRMKADFTMFSRKCLRKKYIHFCT